MKNSLFKQQEKPLLCSHIEQRSLVKVQFGNIASDARGKIGGTTYAKNRSGPYAKRKTSPTNRNTTLQSVVRSNFTDLTKAWGSVLTQAQQTEWNNFAVLWPRTDVFGNAVKISGQNMFISLGQRAKQIGIPFLTDPPADLGVISIPIDPTSWSIASGVYTFQQTAAHADASQLFYIFATAGLPPGRQARSTDFRFLTSRAAGVTPFPSTIDVSTEYTTLFGFAATGARVAIAVGTINNVTLGVDTAIQMSTIVG